MATFQEVRAQAQQGNTDAIATLLNYALKKDNLQTKVKASGSCLAVYIRGQQAPDSSLVPRLKKSLDQLAIKRFEHLEVSAYQVGQAEVVWTSRAPLTPVATPPPKAATTSVRPQVTVTASTTSSSQPHQGPFTLLGRELPENPWFKRIAGLIAAPLLIINSIQFMLLTQTQLFGLIDVGEGWFNPQTNERISNIFMYFVYFGRGYLWYGTLLFLGVLAARYAFHPRSQRAHWMVLGLATIPTILWLVGILTDPLLHFSEADIFFPSSSSPPQFMHPTLGQNTTGWGQNITRWKKWILIAFDLALMGGLVGLWIMQILRGRRQTSIDNRLAETSQGKQQRRATQVMAIVAVIVLLVTNPSHHQHAKSRALRDLAANNPGQSNISREDMARYIEGQKKSTTYRSALFFSWGLAPARNTFGVLGRVYYFRLKPSSDKLPTRLDVFNPFSEFRQKQND
jgi:hypothetical protein